VFGKVEEYVRDCGVASVKNPKYNPNLDVTKKLDCTSYELAQECLRPCIDYIIYSAEEIRGMWLAHIVPGIVGFVIGIKLDSRKKNMGQEGNRERERDNQKHLFILPPPPSSLSQLGTWCLFNIWDTNLSIKRN
jgi:hypothetical protein